MIEEVEQLLDEHFPKGVPPTNTVEERLAIAAALEKELQSVSEQLQ